jgi:type IV secretion system protein VirB6
MAVCPAISDTAFLSSLLVHLDCQALAIGAGGYQALSAPGSGMAMMLTGVLTIFVALFGYRMLLGERPGVREAVMAAVKIGIVLLLATSWPAFRTLAYNVALKGPAELAANIGGPAELPGAGGGLVLYLQGVDNQMAELAKLGTGKPADADVMAGPTESLTPQQQQQEMQRLNQLQQRPRWDPVRDAKLLGQARTVYLTATVAAFASVRLIAGLMLALGPFFALFLLFGGTRGLFEGWVRALGGAALGAVATAIVLGVQVALVAPWLAGVLALRRDGIATPDVSTELLALSLVFALALLAVLVATARIAMGFRFPPPLQRLPGQFAGTIRSRLSQETARDARGGVVPGTRDRAIAIADAVAANQRREAASPPPQTAYLARAASTAPARAREDVVPVAVRLGQSFRRGAHSRVSAAAARRDGTA